jgi:D-tyrosyl-tRNA(Tyr) deacylase
MRAVIQRVTEASVKVNGIITGEIKTGFVILLGIGEDDSEDDVEWLAKKIINIRIFNDENEQMNRSLEAVNGEILLISQFTLFAQTKKGNRPGFIQAAKPPKAIPLYELMAARLEHYTGKPTQRGVFGADMKVSLLNDGPVTIIMNTKDKENF